jgi:hypothetical protein
MVPIAAVEGVDGSDLMNPFYQYLYRIYTESIPIFMMKKLYRYFPIQKLEKISPNKSSEV